MMSTIEVEGKYQVHKVISHSARIKRLLGKALIAENGFSLVKINNAE